MPSIQIYSNFADVALAAYGQNLSTNVPNVEKYRADGMARPQAEAFEAKWQVLGQAEIGNGFSAALFQNRFSGEKALWTNWGQVLQSNIPSG